MPHTTKRHNRAYRIAYWSDIQRMFYTATLTAVIHRWAWSVIALLIPSAVTVLQFLAALNRSGRGGYLGTAVAYELLSPIIAGATGRPCSVSTLKRGIRCLKTLGLIDVRRWTMPDQRISIGDREIVIRGTGRVQTGRGSEWRSLQINILVLTQRALDLWCKSTELQCDRNVGQFPTQVKMSSRSPDDSCVNTHRVKSEHRNDVTADSSQEINLEEGRPTRPTTQTPLTVEQRTVDPSTTPDHQTTTQQDTPEPNEVGSSSPPPAEPIPGHGPSKPRPFVLRGALKKPSWHHGRAIILRALFDALHKFTTREADAIYTRAQWELSRDYPAGWDVSVNWAYWVAKFGEFSPAQRRFHLYRDIIPVLRTKTAITPSEPRRYRQGGEPARAVADPAGLADTLDPFLALVFKAAMKKLE